MKSEDEPTIFTHDLFTQIVGERGKLLSWKPVELDDSSGVLSSLSKTYPHPVGHFGFQVTYTPNQGESPDTLLTVIKSKVTGPTVEDTLCACAQRCGPPISTAYSKYKNRTAFSYCHIRELEMYKIRDKRFTDIVPEVHCVYSDPEKIALRDIAGFHSIHLGNVESLLQEYWLESYSLQTRVELSELWTAFVDNSRQRMPEIWTENRYRIVTQIIASLAHIWTVLESSPRTLIHNDFNPRNACIRIQPISIQSTTDEPISIQSTTDEPVSIQSTTDEPISNQSMTGKPTKRLCLYDWECADVHVPQYDVAEFLAFTVPTDSHPSVRQEYVEFYREELEKQSGRAFDKERFHKVFFMACCDFAVYRAACYSLLPAPTEIPSICRALQSHLGYLEYLDAQGILNF